MKYQIRSALTFAALILIVALGARQAEAMGLFALDPARVNGITTGLILIWFGNAMPKGSPEQTCGNDPAESFRMKRFAGWAFVLAGTAHAAIWLIAPAAIMAELSVVPVAAAVVIVIAVMVKTRRFV